MRVGLTGSIATGKSTVSSYLKQKGIAVIDADLVAREVVEPGGRAYDAVKQAFPEAFEEGLLVRPKLGQIIFQDSEKRQQLNQLMHPSIRQQMLDEADAYERSGHALIVFDIPLLLEGDWRNLFERVVVVYCPEDMQLRRLMQRNDLSETEAYARIHAQLSIEQKKELADDVLFNDGSLDSLYHQIDEWLVRYDEQDT
ncbi:dephospho-CoA kinase [Exiguobacterium acetylicum]|uniref:dephospho-CoA kinase n=1 Tax=Exiguobacterium sp. BMC-KP TaxID=1684312 RepID=UPI0006AA2742|nr:dephospho-CoA kinase [Exiguobacterium sp. BMC-KP]KOP29949.1 dephospho-CoA kinase [Exiguobacterium sp. BMC-KP]